MLRLLDRYFEPVLIVGLVSAMTLLIVLQVLLRIFDASLSQAEEGARILFVWAVYLSISYAIRDNRHVRVTVIVDSFPEFFRQLARNIADLVFFAYSAVVVVFGVQIVRRSLELGQIAPATELPVAVIYASVVVSSSLCIVRLGKRIWQRTRRLNEGLDP